MAAITYYIEGLISYLAKGAESLGWPWSAPSTAAATIPLVLFSVWWSLRRLHQRYQRYNPLTAADTDPRVSQKESV